MNRRRQDPELLAFPVDLDRDSSLALGAINLMVPASHDHSGQPLVVGEAGVAALAGLLHHDHTAFSQLLWAFLQRRAERHVQPETQPKSAKLYLAGVLEVDPSTWPCLSQFWSCEPRSGSGSGRGSAVEGRCGGALWLALAHSAH
jgi:hypothetical protein